MKNVTKRSLNLAIFESVITAGLLSMPIMSLFYKSEIGMTNEQIALSQSIFTIVMIALDLPMGWIADRFSRKWANIIGDFGRGIGFLIYASVNSFSGVVFSEVWLAIFGALSAGVDVSLVRHFANKLDESEKLFKSKMASLAFWENIVTMVLMLLGGPIGAISHRLAIALCAVTMVIGGVASIFIVDDSEKLKPTHKNPLRDLFRVTKESTKNKKLRLRILAQAFGSESTHSMIWFFSPIMVMCGVPDYLVSIGWVLNSATSALGAKLAKRYATKMPDWKVLAIPTFLMFISMGVLAIKISIYTIPFYLITGLVRGWTYSTLRSLTQQHAKAAEQTSVSSLASTVGRLIYALVGWLVGMAADVNMGLAALVNLAVFTPAGIIITLKLKRER